MADASITIPNIDGETLSLLEAESQRRGVAVTELAREILRDSVAKPAAASEPSATKVKSGPPPGPPYHDLDFLCGTWTEADVAEFEAATADFNEIDPEAWK